MSLVRKNVLECKIYLVVIRLSYDGSDTMTTMMMTMSMEIKMILTMMLMMIFNKENTMKMVMISIRSPIQIQTNYHL